MVAKSGESLRLERLEKFEKNLAELVQEHTFGFRNAVRETLDDKERRIYDLGLRRYSQETGRWYDPWGIPDSVLDFKFILDSEKVSERDKLLAFAVLIYHDSGYPNLENSADYSTQKLKDLHMRIGPKNFMEDVSELMFGGGYVFNRSELVKGVEAIARHDEKYFEDFNSLNLPEMLRIFMDGDTIFVPSFISVYKDYVAKYATPKQNNLNGEEFLRMRQSYFFDKDEDNNYCQKICITDESNAKYGYKKLPIRFESTKKVLASHMLARTEELEFGLFDMAYEGNWDTFKDYAVAYLMGSMQVAKAGQSYDMIRYGDKI